MGKKVRITVDVTELGRKGGKARGQSLSSDELSEAGRNAVAERWRRYYEQHPEKLAKKRSAESRKKVTAKKSRKVA